MYLEIKGMNIHNNISGKVLEAALTDGKALILRATDGHEYRIEWVDGEPVLQSINVRIQIAGITGAGAAAVL